MYLGFFVLFMSYNCVMNLASQVLQDVGLGSLGFYLVGTRFFFASLFSLLAPFALNKFGANRCLLIGGLGHFLFVFTAILPCLVDDYPLTNAFLSNKMFIIVTLFIGCILNGISAPLLWAA